MSFDKSIIFATVLLIALNCLNEARTEKQQISSDTSGLKNNKIDLDTKIDGDHGSNEEQSNIQDDSPTPFEQSMVFQKYKEFGDKLAEAKRLRQTNEPDEALKILKELQQEIHIDYSGLFKELVENEIASIITEKASKLHDQGKYREASSTSLKDLEAYGNQLDVTLKTVLKNEAALQLLETGEYARSYELFEEVLQQIIKYVGPEHYYTLAPQSHIARVLGHLGKYEDSLRLFKDVLKRMEKAGGHPLYYTTRLNLGSLMMRVGAYQEALEHLQIVLERHMRVSGPDHDDTLSTQTNLATALMQLDRLSEASDIYTQVFNKRKETLGFNHPHTLTPQFYLGQIMVEQGKYLEALRTYNVVLERSKLLLGESHQLTQTVSGAIGVLKERMESDKFTELQTLCKNSELERLHDRINSGDKNGVNDLLADGIVDITQATAQEGNSPLHIAVDEDNTDIVESLLEYAKKKLTQSELVEFIDAKTASAVGDTAMHIAASNGSLESMKALLRYGATYNIKNKRGKTPIDQTNEPEIKSFLGLIDEMFDIAKRGDFEVVSKLQALNKDEQLAMTNARNDQGYSLEQVPKSASHSTEL